MTGTARTNRLLLITDDRFYRELIANKYRNNPVYSVESISSADNLQDRLRSSPDAIILDEQLSNTNTVAIPSVVRLNSPATPIFVLTADSGSANRNGWMIHGAYDVVVKDEFTVELLDRLLSRTFQEIPSGKNYTLTGQPVTGENIATVSLRDGERSLEDYTMDIIQQFLAKYDNNVVLVARKLGVGKSTIYRYLKDKKLSISGKPEARQTKQVPAPVYSIASVGYSSPGSTGFNPISDSSSDGHLVDLDYLLNIYNGDRNAVAGMIDVFFQTMGRHVDQLKKYQSELDLTGVLRCLQEMKPVVEYISMHSLKSHIVQAKMMIETHMDWGVINNQLSEVYSLYTRCVDELRQKRSSL
ncbi:MAG: hypothetical protein RL021_2045 [Bacteroidota bacterium]|jgi:DNA-binding response OmpR family regulator